MTTYVVLWTHGPTRHLIDFDDEALALRAAIELGELGRIDIAVTKVEYEPNEADMALTRERIRTRLAMEWAIGAIT